MHATTSKAMMLLQIQELQQKLQHAQSQAAHTEASQGELQERAQKAQESLEVQPVFTEATC